MKITRFILVFLIFASLLLAGCTDRKAKSSDPSADLPKPTITSGTPETSQPGSQETPAPDTDSRTSEPSDPADTTADHESAAATTENTSGTDPAVTETADDPGDPPVEEDATIIASGDVEFIGGD